MWVGGEGSLLNIPINILSPSIVKTVIQQRVHSLGCLGRHVVHRRDLVVKAVQDCLLGRGSFA